MFYPCETSKGIFLVCLENGRISRICFPDKNFLKKSSVPDIIKELSFDLDRYFGGENVGFDKYDLYLSGTEFQKNVWRFLSTIPYGTTVSYSDVARYLGNSAVRAVGSACGKNRIPIIIPCHRVIPKNGSLGGFSAGEKWKIFLLNCEKNISTKSKEL